MGVLEKLFGRKNQIEPFPENQSDAEKLNWFKKTQPWDKVDERIINAIIKKYNGDPKIVVFVVTSMEHNLIPMYCKHNNAEYLDSPDLICSLIAQTLYSLGSISLKQLGTLMENIFNNQEKFKLHYSIVMDSLESCIILDENQVSAYAGIAMAKALLRQPEGTLKYAQQGLAVIKRIKENNYPFHLSKDKNIKNAARVYDEIEKYLNQLIAEFKTV